MDSFAPRGRIVELACGTGIWTQEILRHPVAELLCIDAAPEMLEIHESRIDDPRVRRERHNLFTWEADDRYDAAIFAFWLSHVPPVRFAEFWGTVERTLKPGGRVFFVDDDHRAEVDEERVPDAEVPAVLRHVFDPLTERRTSPSSFLNQPQALAGALAELGWDAEVHSAGHRFLWGTASRR